jgi:hypothetical protein
MLEWGRLEFLLRLLLSLRGLDSKKNLASIFCSSVDMIIKIIDGQSDQNSYLESNLSNFCSLVGVPISASSLN